MRCTIKEKHPELNICGYHHGYFDIYSDENSRVVEKIVQASPDIILVCLGSPKQEIWIMQNAQKIPSLKLSIGLGGSFDVWSGEKKRAPMLFRKLYLEWLYRIITDPKRLSFLFDIPIFIFYILRQKLIIEKQINGKNAH